MTDAKQLARDAKEMVEAIDSGRADPLQFSLANPYQTLRSLRTGLPIRVTIDETLNEVLKAKVSRVQELTRVLTTPEALVEIVKQLPPREMARLVRYKRPVTVSKMTYQGLSRSLERIIRAIASQVVPDVDEPTPEILERPTEFVFEVEEPIPAAKIDSFLDMLPYDEPVSVHSLLRSVDVDELLERFLIIIILISRGRIEYDPQTGMVMKRSSKGGRD